MDLIVFDADYKEIGPVMITGDFEIGDNLSLNNFEISEINAEAYGIYSPDTEVGGIFEYKDTAYKENPIIRGWTWRGLLTQCIISPADGDDYVTVSGEANNILRNLLSNCLGGLFYVPDQDSGLVITNHQFERYCTCLDGIMDMLSEHGYRLKIYARKNDQTHKVQICAEAVEVVTAAGEYNDDSDVKLRMIDNQMGINHLICLGQGELHERQRLDLYVNEKGKIGTAKYYTGFKERTAVYDYTAAESLKSLKSYGIKKLKTIMPTKKLKIDMSEADLEIGDLVKGYYRDGKISVLAPVTKKIYRVQGEHVDIEYMIKEV